MFTTTDNKKKTNHCSRWQLADYYLTDVFSNIRITKRGIELKIILIRFFLISCLIYFFIAFFENLKTK